MHTKIEIEVDELNDWQTTLRVTDGNYTARYITPSQLEIGKAIKHAIANFFHFKNQQEQRELYALLVRK